MHMNPHDTDWASIVEKQSEMERQLHAMAATVKALEARVAELGRLEAAREGEVAAISASAETATEVKSPRTKPETVAVLTAAATVFLGKSVKVRSAQPLPDTQDGAGAWARQGRVSVQTSHNPR
jgi:hypothetical protein